MENIKVERGVPLPPKVVSPYQEALLDMREGDCITVAKCKTKTIGILKNGTDAVEPISSYYSDADSAWMKDNCKPVQRIFYDDDGDMGLKLWKVDFGK